MREIKFRAWDSFNNRMIQNYRILKICFVRSNHIPSFVVYSNKNIENHTKKEKMINNIYKNKKRSKYDRD